MADVKRVGIKREDIAEGFALLPQACDFALRMLPKIWPLFFPYVVVSLFYQNLPKYEGFGGGSFKGWLVFWGDFVGGLTYIGGTAFLAYIAQASIVAIIAVRGFEMLESKDVRPFWHFGKAERWALNANWAITWSMCLAGLLIFFFGAAILALSKSATVAYISGLVGAVGIFAIIYIFLASRALAIPMSIAEAIGAPKSDLKMLAVGNAFTNKQAPKLIKRALARANGHLISSLVALILFTLIFLPAITLKKFYWDHAVIGEPSQLQTILMAVNSGFFYLMFNLVIYFCAHIIWRKTGGFDAPIVIPVVAVKAAKPVLAAPITA